MEDSSHEIEQLKAECERWRQECARLRSENEKLRRIHGLEAVESVTREFAAFAYAVSHDLKEPLRKVQVFGERLEKSAGSELDGQSLDYLTRMRSAARRMGDMIEGLLEVSRVTTRGEGFAEVDLETVVREAEADVESLRIARGARVRCGALPRVQGDAHQLRRVFANLLTNSLQNARPEIPVAVEIRALEKPNSVEITIEDNGAGFAPEDAEKIFEVFARLETGRDRAGGNGVGLTICRKIAERHRGTIVATGVPEQGASFTLTLPRSRD